MRIAAVVVLLIFVFSGVALAKENQWNSQVDIRGAIGFPFQNEFRDLTGNNLWGADFTYRYILIDAVGIGARVGFRTNAEKGKEVLPWDAYIGINKNDELCVYHGSSLIMPIQVIVTYEILGKSTYAPYIGLGVGGSWVKISSYIESLPNTNPNYTFDKDSFNHTNSQFVPTITPMAGFDFRFSDMVGLFFDVQYNYMFKYNAEYYLPGVHHSRDDQGHRTSFYGKDIYKITVDPTFIDIGFGLSILF